MAEPTIRFGYFEAVGLSFFRHTDRKVCVQLPSTGEWMSHPDAVIARDLLRDQLMYPCQRPHPNTSGN